MSLEMICWLFLLPVFVYEERMLLSQQSEEEKQKELAPGNKLSSQLPW